jgi:hypothetical protein
MHNFSVQTVSLQHTPQLWDQLHTTAQSATIFSSASWLSTLANVFGKEAIGVLLMEADRPVAGIPLLTSRKGFLRLSPPLPITLYAGWLATHTAHAMEAGIRQLYNAIEHRWHYVSLTMPESDITLPLMREHGWSVAMRHSRRLSLQDPEALWNGYSQSLRRKIRRAEGSDLSIDTDPDSSILADCYGQSYQRHGITPPIPQNRVQEWLTELRRQGMITCYAAIRADGRCAATRAVIRDDTVLYDWLAGSNPTLAASASHWLLHRILESHAHDGVEHFDFMGANTPGVVDFKRSFGGTLTAYAEAEWYRPSLLRHVNTLRNKHLRRKRGLA